MLSRIEREYVEGKLITSRLYARVLRFRIKKKLKQFFEVETASQWKKDIVTTWETEPKLAVILAHYKSEKGIKNIVQFILLKDMPHKLLFINNVTKKAYLVEKQNILKYYDIEKREEIASDVLEY